MPAIRIVCVPAELAIYITGPIPGDCDDPDCDINPDEFDGIDTLNGEAIVEMENGARHCLYYHHEGGDAGSFGSISLYCPDASSPFKVIPFQYTSTGIADGRRCFCVDC